MLLDSEAEIGLCYAFHRYRKADDPILGEKEMSAEKLIHDAADQCEWDPDMALSVLADFIDEFCDPDDFKAFLEARVADEAGDDYEEGEEEERADADDY